MEGKPRAPFRYDSASWGVGTIRPDERSLSGRRLAYCLADLEPVSGAVLEIGCARGQFIRSIRCARPDLSVFGCDINSVAVRMNSAVPDGVSYSVGDAGQLPYSDARFDAVVLFDLLEHLEDPERCLREVRRVLKPHGVFHAYVPCEGQPGTLHWILWKLGIAPDLKRKHRGHLQRFSIRSCLRMVEAASLRVHSRRISGYWIEQILDLSFYFLLELGWARERLWTAHSEDEAGVAGAGSGGWFLGRLRDLAFRIGYFETKLFGNWPWALGLHVCATRSQDDP